jgi:hypothetical protein
MGELVDDCEQAAGIFVHGCRLLSFIKNGGKGQILPLFLEFPP